MAAEKASIRAGNRLSFGRLHFFASPSTDYSGVRFRIELGGEAMPRTHLRRGLIDAAYAEYAREYLRGLRLENHMEATGQATQRKITLESLDLVNARRPDVQVFNELLVQYPRAGEKKPGQVVPDNMVVIDAEPIDADGSFNVPTQDAHPFWVLEYVSKHNKRKDYDDNFDKYEKELKVPYYLLFYPEEQELTLYRLKGRRYVSVKPNAKGRYAIPELDLELALLDGWVRYWYRDELLPLPAELQSELDAARREAEEQRQRADNAEQRADNAEQRAEALERELEELRRRLK
jgi:Uma2 family endonuclease